MSDRPWPDLTPLKAYLRRGKPALMWHLLRAEQGATARPIVCVQCQRAYQRPPRFGACTCGSYRFEVAASGEGPAAAEGRMAGSG